MSHRRRHGPNLNWRTVANGDYYSDGRAGLLWRNYATGQVFMMTMSGLTITGSRMIHTAKSLPPGAPSTRARRTIPATIDAGEGSNAALPALRRVQ